MAKKSETKPEDIQAALDKLSKDPYISTMFKGEIKTLSTAFSTFDNVAVDFTQLSRAMGDMRKTLDEMCTLVEQGGGVAAPNSKSTRPRASSPDTPKQTGIEFYDPIGSKGGSTNGKKPHSQAAVAAGAK